MARVDHTDYAMVSQPKGEVEYMGAFVRVHWPNGGPTEMFYVDELPRHVIESFKDAGQNFPEIVLLPLTRPNS